MIHDASLLRTAGVDVNIEDLTAEDLENYRLEGTDEKIPLFREVLELFDGKAPMIVELKAVGENYAALTEAACRMLEAYEGLYCIESFDPRCIQWLRKHHPHIIRGQLAADFKGKRLGQSPVTLFLLTHNMLNFLSVPDFVAYRFTDRKKTVSIPLCRYAWDIQGAAWTIRTREEYNAAVKEGWLPIFEGFEP